MEINGKKVRELEQHRKNPVYKTKKQQVFIIGSKGIPAAYGGFETFVDKLKEYQKSDKIGDKIIDKHETINLLK